MRLFLSLFFSLSALYSIAQEPVDTLDTPNGQIILFADRSWEYLEDLNFDGVMNEHLHDLIESDSNLTLVHPWNHDQCYPSNGQNDLSKMKDTLWICVVDDMASDFRMPVDGIVTSRYGYRKGRYHNGIDLDLETGDTVRSAWSGKVRYAKYNDGGFGNLVIVRHDNGLETFYAHLSKIDVMPNQTVNAGQPIGLGGNTGRSYGSHLHFEVRFYDSPLNPEEVIDFEKRQCRDHNLLVHKDLFRPGAKPTHSNSASSQPGATSVATATSASASKYYRIKSGDTLGSIAAKHRTTVSALCRLNGIRPTTTIQAGKSLRVR